MSKITDFINNMIGKGEEPNIPIKDNESTVDNVKEPLDTVPEGYVYREPDIFGVNLNDWTGAVQQSWSETNPNRIDLCDIYKAITTYDSQTVTAIQQRKLYTMHGDLAFYNENGEINDEATKMIKSPSGATKLWFRDFISATLDAIFWGFELVAIDVKNGKVYIKKVPERNVIPSLKSVLVDALYGNSNKIPYNKGKLDLITCKISYDNDLHSLGLLSSVAPYFFSKVTGNWKQHADKFGMLTRVLKTSSENKTKLLAGYKALQNQVRANFVILGQDDELTFDGDTRTNVDMYEKLNKYCDSSISKIILGQSSTTDEKSYAGSSEVHQDVLENIIRSDREFVESIVNDQLVPKLQMFGLLPQNIYFGISESVNIDLNEQANIVKTLSDAGFKPTKEYITKTFDVELDDNEQLKTDTDGSNNQ